MSAESLVQWKARVAVWPVVAPVRWVISQAGTVMGRHVRRVTSASIRRSQRVAWLSAMAGLLLVATNAAAESDVTTRQFEPDRRIAQSEGFISARRDVFHRREGIRHVVDGQYAAAAEAFRAAARYADKLSQATYAEMLWQGRPGVAQDRALAYAWMDLAAERGNSVALLARREAYWEALTEAERAHALDVGEAVYAEYGDEVAQPRQERVMQRARRGSTGSRVGAASGNLRVVMASDMMGSDPWGNLASQSGIDGAQYYDDRYWEPARHWALQDREMERALQYRINIGDIENYLPDASPPPPSDDSPG